MEKESFPQQLKISLSFLTRLELKLFQKFFWTELELKLVKNQFCVENTVCLSVSGTGWLAGQNIGNGNSYLPFYVVENIL